MFFSGITGDIDTTTLAVPGTYTLLVEGRRYQTGSTNTYRFAVQPVANVAPVVLNLEAKPGPDLVVTDIAVSSAGPLESGSIVTVGWTDRNNGTLPTNSNWRDRLVVRNGANEIIGNVIVAYNAATDGALAPGEFRARSVDIALPDGATGAGDLSFAVFTDIDNALAEENVSGNAESNNSTAVVRNVALAAYPDLLASGLVVTPPGAWTPGSTVSLGWRVDNAGNRVPGADWNETVQVRNTLTGETIFSQTFSHTLAGDGALAAGAGLDRNVSFTWASGRDVAGRVRVHRQRRRGRHGVRAQRRRHRRDQQHRAP